MAGAIKPLEVEGAGETVQAGTVSAGYQNFLICVEMFFAAIGLHLAFPYSTYEQCTLLSDGPEGPRASTMQVNYPAGSDSSAKCLGVPHPSSS